jgi:hypothetical protein
MIAVHHEPEDVPFAWMQETCRFCKTPTPFWARDKKTPVCPTCAQTHHEWEITARKLDAEVQGTGTSNCAGEIFVASSDPGAVDGALRIGHFQGDAQLAQYVCELHNAATAARRETTP